MIRFSINGKSHELIHHSELTAPPETTELRPTGLVFIPPCPSHAEAQGSSSLTNACHTTSPWGLRETQHLPTAHTPVQLWLHCWSRCPPSSKRLWGQKPLRLVCWKCKPSGHLPCCPLDGSLLGHLPQSPSQSLWLPGVTCGALWLTHPTLWCLSSS